MLLDDSLKVPADSWYICFKKLNLYIFELNRVLKSYIIKSTVLSIQDIRESLGESIAMLLIFIFQKYKNRL